MGGVELALGADVDWPGIAGGSAATAITHTAAERLKAIRHYPLPFQPRIETDGPDTAKVY